MTTCGCWIGEKAPCQELMATKKPEIAKESLWNLCMN